MTRAAKSSGDFGDTVYALPVLKYHGCRKLYLAAANYTRQRLTWDKWQPLVPLLRAQSYLDSVEEWLGQAIDINTDDFRQRLGHSIRNRELESHCKSLCSWQLETHGVPDSEKDKPWITVPEPNRVASVVINRTQRYHNKYFPWPDIVKKYGKDCVFIGAKEEHGIFCNQFGSVPYYHTPDLLEAAKVIRGADLFVGNQSVCYSICEGMKQSAILEVAPFTENCLFYRENLIHGILTGLYRPILKP